jgi:hypothetical protein
LQKLWKNYEKENTALFLIINAPFVKTWSFRKAMFYKRKRLPQLSTPQPIHISLRIRYYLIFTTPALKINLIEYNKKRRT